MASSSSGRPQKWLTPTCPHGPGVPAQSPSSLHVTPQNHKNRSDFLPLCHLRLLSALGQPRPQLPSLSLSHAAECSEGTPSPFQVFQRRNTGQLDFFKRWRTYVEGFGDPTQEFWFGTGPENLEGRVVRGTFPLTTKGVENAHRWGFC